MRSIYFRRIFIVTLMLSNVLAIPAPIAGGSAWISISGISWEGAADGKKEFDLTKDIAVTWIDAKTVEGHWLKVVGSAPAEASNFKVWIHLFYDDGHFVSLVLPTTKCIVRPESNSKICSNIAWIPKGGDRVRVSFYGPEGPHKVTPVSVQYDKEEYRKIRTSAIERYNKDIKRIKDIYFWRDKVNWLSIYHTGYRVLYAPKEINPLPQALLQVKNKLPDHTHMYFFANGKGEVDFKPLSLPTCVKLTKKISKLVLPETVPDKKMSGLYIKSVHSCLRNNSNRWIVDLTNDRGGDLAVQLAALAPIIGSGSKLQFINSDGAKYVVSLKKNAVFINGEEKLAWKGNANIGLKESKVTFVIGPGCASACEMIAMAIKGNFALVGKQTAGMTSVNESIPISRDLLLAVTSGLAAYMDGATPYPKGIQPDKLLSSEEIRRLLTYGHH